MDWKSSGVQALAPLSGPAGVGTIEADLRGGIVADVIAMTGVVLIVKFAVLDVMA